jgi:hypothetical protein
MTSEYGKVVIGDAVEDERQPLILGVTVERDIEAQAYSVPSRGEVIYNTQPVIYGTYPTSSQITIQQRDPGEHCAFIGCLLSWIPLIGFVTFIIHCDAPVESRRSYWARTACIISSLIVFFNMVFWPIWFN